MGLGGAGARWHSSWGHRRAPEPPGGLGRDWPGRPALQFCVRPSLRALTCSPPGQSAWRESPARGSTPVGRDVGGTQLHGVVAPPTGRCCGRQWGLEWNGLALPSGLEESPWGPPACLPGALGRTRGTRPPPPGPEAGVPRALRPPWWAKGPLLPCARTPRPAGDSAAPPSPPAPRPGLGVRRRQRARGWAAVRPGLQAPEL